MKLYIVRHGQAELLTANDQSEASDRQRALTAEGRREAQAAGQHLKQVLSRDEIPKILVSPYRRAQETAQEIINLFGFPSDCLVTLDNITPKNSPKEALAALQPYEASDALIMISHQPLVSQLIGHLVWHKDEPSIAMGTAYIACLELEALANDAAELLWVKSPRAFS